MILVASSALIFAGVRLSSDIFREYLAEETSGSNSLRQWATSLSTDDVVYYVLSGVVLIFWGFAFSLTPAFLIIRLRRPRPSFRDLVLQPGVVACEATLLGHGLTVSQALFEWLPEPLYWAAVATSIPLAWAALAMRGRWRPEPGWIDRLGRILGVCWVVGYVLLTVLKCWGRIAL